MEPTPRDLATRYIGSFATGDADLIASHVAMEFRNEHTSALGSGCTGRDQYRRRLPDFLAAFAGLHYDIEHVIADGSEVAVAYRMTAHYDGHPIDLRGVMTMTVASGVIARRTDYWDSLTFLRQTGQA